MGDKCRKQMEDKCKLMRPKAPRVRDKRGRQVRDKTCVGDKWETSANSCGPRQPEWETSVGDKCGRQVGDKCKIMPQDTQSERQGRETSGR